MAKILLNIKVDPDVKKKAKKLAEGLGLSLSVLVNAQLKQIIHSQRVSFSLPHRMNPSLEKLLTIVEKDLKNGQNLSPVFGSGKEMDDYLDSR